MHWLVLAALLSMGVASAGLYVTADPRGNGAAPVTEGTILANGGTEDMTALSGEWRVTWIAFAELPPDVPILLRFAPGRVSGLAGCSTFEGTLTVTGNALSLGPVESGGTECAPEWMKATSDFLRVLSLSNRYELGPEGRLKLLGANIATLEATR